MRKPSANKERQDREEETMHLSTPRDFCLGMGTLFLFLGICILAPIIFFLEWREGDSARQQAEGRYIARAEILRKVETPEDERQGGLFRPSHEDYEVRWTAHDGVQRQGILRLQRSINDALDVAHPGQRWYIRISPSDPYHISHAADVARHIPVAFAGFQFSKPVWLMIAMTSGGLVFLLVGLCLPRTENPSSKHP